MDYYFSKTVSASYDEAIRRTTEALQSEGFGVISEIKMHDKLKEKLNVDFKKYTILGACNPPLAYKALTARPDVGLLLPCNVIVYEDGNATVVNIIDPLSMTIFVQDPALESVAEEARQRLKRVSEAIQE